MVHKPLWPIRKAGIVFLGDFWHSRGALPVELLNMAIMELRSWQCPAIFIPGNHDQVCDEETLTIVGFSHIQVETNVGNWVIIAKKLNSIRHHYYFSCPIQKVLVDSCCTMQCCLLKVYEAKILSISMRLLGEPGRTSACSASTGSSQSLHQSAIKSSGVYGGFVAAISSWSFTHWEGCAAAWTDTRYFCSSWHRKSSTLAYMLPSRFNFCRNIFYL